MGDASVLEVRIDSLAGDGDGVARDASGRVIFVPFTAPGDRVRVRVVEARRRFARARVETLLEPGPSRTSPHCPVFGECGGCTWQHVDYATQVEAKRRILEEALQRVGGIRPPGGIGMVASPQPYAYRARARVRVEGGHVGYRRRRSHALCPVRGCPLLLPALDACLARLASHPPAREGEWELAAGDDGSVRAAPLPSPPGPSVELRVRGETLQVSPGVFAQANGLLRETLVEAVCEAAGRGETLLELHAGAGFFTLSLARHWRRLVAVEADSAAVRDLRRNLAAAGLDHVEVRARPVETVLGGPPPSRLAPEVVVLDPPRTGLPPGAARALANLGASRVVYVSCDPATLARDLAVLGAGGLAVRRVQGFDLFPQTPHVETLAVLERS